MQVGGKTYIHPTTIKRNSYSTPIDTSWKNNLGLVFCE